MTKSIWLPESKLKATIVDGNVKVWDEITMYEKPLASLAGFGKAPELPEPAIPHVYSTKGMG